MSIPEPMLTCDLEENPDTSPAGYAKILQTLASQLGQMNDYYMPLMDVARMLDGKIHARDCAQERIGK